MYSILAYVNKNKICCNCNTVLVQLKSSKEGKQFQQSLLFKVWTVVTVLVLLSLWRQFCVISTTFPDSVRFFHNFQFPVRYVSDKSIDEFRLPYETYHTSILFLKRYVRTLTYCILAYAYPRAMLLSPIRITVRMPEQDCFLPKRMCSSTRNFIMSGESHVLVLGARRSSNAWLWGVETPLSEVNAL